MKYNIKYNLRKVFSLVLVVLMLFTTFTFNVNRVEAKGIGEKNEKACDVCEAVRDGTTPTDASGNPYTDELVDDAPGSVFRGGNARSGIQNGPSLDSNQNDFATPLPYGNVFVDTSKLTWTNPSGFTIDIKDDRFQWVAVDGKMFTDANGETTTNDPLGSKKNLKGRTLLDTGGLDSGAISNSFIAYVGELKPYHDDIKAKADNNGFTNEIKASDKGLPYLYQITYYNAATLADGTKGNLVMTMMQVDIETSMNISEDNTRVLTDKNGNPYTYTKAVMPIQDANNLRVAAGVLDSEDNWVNEPYTVAKTAAEVQASIDEANANIPNSDDKIGQSMAKDKMIRHTAGGAYTFEIKVVDSQGQPAVGTMAYAANDLDLPSYQNIWGRDRSDPFMYSEGLTIINGSQSYALVPEYNHSNGNTVNTGWVPKGLGGSWDSPLDIKKDGNGSHADGVTFRSNGEKVLRDQNGLWKDAFTSWNENATKTIDGVKVPDPQMSIPEGSIRDFMWQNLNAARLSEKADLSTTKSLDNNVKKQLAGKIDKPWDTITAADAVAYLKNGSYAVERGDDGTYDTGFAVLIDPAGTTFRWTGSSYNSGSAVTRLFDDTLYTYIEQTHGTGGGIYLESYNLKENCKSEMEEGTVTMGRNSETTVTAVPEKGYRVSRITIGNTNYKDHSKSSLTDFETYTIDGNKIKDKNGTVLAEFTEGKATIAGYYYDKNDDRKSTSNFTLEKNTDGTIDVTLPKVDNPMHVHVDFATDYYIYKVWKNTDTKEITDITFNATPYSYSSDSELTVNSTLQAQTFKVKKEDANNRFENNIQSTIVGDNVVWEIKYPSEGYKTQSGELWPALAIESEPSEHNKIHIDRIYWFVTETAPTGFVVESYDNSAIKEVPGKAEETYKDTNWYKESVKYANRFKEVLNRTGDKAFMSIFEGYESGAKITNIPQTASISIFKKWDDENNADGLRIELANAVELQVKLSENQYGSATTINGDSIVKGTVPTEDGLIITWINVPVYRKGELITYKVTENVNGLTGYTTDPGELLHEFTLVHGQNKEATFTNKRTPDLTEITITKQWDDNENEYLKRPNEVTVQLIKTYLQKNVKEKEADKKVTVNGNEYVVKITADNIRYFVIDNNYYRDDDIEKVNAVITDYEQLIPFNPDDSGNIVTNNKIHVVDEVEYQVLVTNDGTEYYKVEDKYFNLQDTELDESTDDFNPTDEDKAATEKMTIEVDEVTYDIKSGKLADKEQWYYVKNVDGKDKYYDISNKELIKFVPSDDNAVKIMVPGEITYGPEKIEYEDVILTAENNWTKTIDVQINAPVEQKIAYGVTEKNAPAAYMMSSVTSTEDGIFVVTNKILPPIANPSETIDYKGKQQTGTPKIEADTRTTGPNGSENKIEEITLLDENGNEVNTVTVPGEGTYTLNEDDTITFTPEPEFVGKTSGVKVRGYDSNGLSAETTYTPTVIVRASYVDPLLPEGEQVVQDSKDSSVPGAKDITTTYEDTPGGKSKNHPGYRFDGWEETIDPNDPSHYIRTAKYTPMHNINYDPNGGTGYMPDNDYPADEPNKPHDKNTFTRKGYTFTGFKAYITDPTTGVETPIVDENGDPIIFQDSNDMAQYFKDMPGGTSIRMEAQWKRNEYHIKYDPNGGSGIMTGQDFTGDDTSAISKTNTFTRGGYDFTGFRAVDKNGNYIGFFTTVGEFIEYLHALGDGGEIILIAQWRIHEENRPSSYSVPKTGIE